MVAAERRRRFRSSRSGSAWLAPEALLTRDLAAPGGCGGRRRACDVDASARRARSLWVDDGVAAVDLAALIDRAWAYQRPVDEPGAIHYPG